MILLVSTALAASVTLHPGDDVASLTAALGAGDEIVFANGIYEIPSDLSWSGAGTQAQPIVLRANEPGKAVLEFVSESGRVATVSESSHLSIDGLVFRGGEGWDLLTQGGLRISNSSDVSVTNCEFTNLGGTVFYLSENNSRITFSHNHIHDTVTSGAIYVGCSDASCWTTGATFEGNLFHGLAGTDDYAMRLEPGSQGFQVVDNVFYDLAYRGIITHSTELGETLAIEGNVLWSVTDIAVYLRGSATVRNNIIFNSGTGIYVADPEWETYSDIVISHNTVVDTEGWGIRLYSWQEKEGMVLTNNVVSNPTGYAFNTDDGNVDDGNMISSNVFTGLVEGLEPLKGHYSAGAGSKDFVDEAGWDFYPSATSTLLAAADPASEAWVPPIDFNHAERDGAAPDVGAYERIADQNPGWPIQEGFKDPGVDIKVDQGEVGGCACTDDGNGQASLLFLPLALFWRRRR